MKTKVKQFQGEPALLKAAPTKHYLKHLLSSLEQAAVLHKFQPFGFKVNGMPIYLPARLRAQMLEGILSKIQLVDRLLEKEKQSRQIPFALREAFDDPKLRRSWQDRKRYYK